MSTGGSSNPPVNIQVDWLAGRMDAYTAAKKEMEDLLGMQRQFNEGWGGGPAAGRGGFGGGGAGGQHPDTSGRGGGGNASAGGPASAWSGNTSHGGGMRDWVNNAKRANEEVERDRVRATQKADEEIVRNRATIFGSTRATQAFYAMTPEQRAAGHAEWLAQTARLSALPNAPVWQASAAGAAPYVAPHLGLRGFGPHPDPGVFPRGTYGPHPDPGVFPQGQYGPHPGLGPVVNPFADRIAAMRGQLEQAGADLAAMQAARSGLFGMGGLGTGALLGGLAAGAAMIPAIHTDQGQNAVGGALSGVGYFGARAFRRNGFFDQYSQNLGGLLNPLVRQGRSEFSDFARAADAEEAANRAQNALARRRTRAEIGEARDAAFFGVDMQRAGLNSIRGIDGQVAATEGRYNTLASRMGSMDPLSAQYLGIIPQMQGIEQDRTRLALQREQELVAPGIRYRDSLINQRDATEGFVRGSIGSLAGSHGLQRLEADFVAMRAGKDLTAKQAQRLSGAGIKDEAIDKALFEEVAKKAPKLAEMYKEMLRIQSDAADKQIEATETALQKLDSFETKGQEKLINAMTKLWEAQDKAIQAVADLAQAKADEMNAKNNQSAGGRSGRGPG